MCRYHWRYVPDVLKEQYQWAKKQALLSVKVSEELR